MKTKIYLVKFDKGYYAEKQPNYHWSYTDDPNLAKRYKTMAGAVETASSGLRLITDSCNSAAIEERELVIMLSEIKETNNVHYDTKHVNKLLITPILAGESADRAS